MKAIQFKIIAVSCLLGSLTGLAQNATLLTTFTNPTPATSDWFGYSVAAMGNDRVLIGAYQNDTPGFGDAGAAYLFSANGTLLTVFTNSAPEFQEQFGFSVAAVGNDRVLIGAPRAGNTVEATDTGAAYLFNTNGSLVNTFTNPTPGVSDYFGWSVAAVGSDLVLISAPYDYDLSDFDPMGAGAAYLFSTNGALLTTFSNSSAANFENFGYSVAAVGSDRVLIGAPGVNVGAAGVGAAFLFNLGGTLLKTFNNPAPAANDKFGQSVTAVGSDLVLIGAPTDGASDNGSAYLFRTDGTLLITFTNPTASVGGNFGWSVAAVGGSRMLIGAHGDSAGAPAAGAVYLFSTNGALLTTITNPAPANVDLFGNSVAVVGNDRVIVGAYFDDAGADDTGSAYLFQLAPEPAPAPSLTISLTTTNMVAVSWPSPSTGWTLQQNTNSISSVNWSNAPGTIQDNGTTKYLIVNPPTGNRFYRLFKP